MSSVLTLWDMRENVARIGVAAELWSTKIIWPLSAWDNSVLNLVSSCDGKDMMCS